MNRKYCPITYEEIDSDNKYSKRGLNKLNPKLNNFRDIPFTSQEQRMQASLRADKISIQGVQAKLSARINLREESFEFVDQGGCFILKPQSSLYMELPENEDLSMRLASLVGIEVPLHGLVYSKDQSMTYFIKRFDRISGERKIAVEDFAQLAGKNRDNKYNYSTEKLVGIIERYCTFPLVEKKRLFLRIIFNFIIGNEDMHLKNWSVISQNGKTELSPAYDLINTTIVLNQAREELALPLNGKKRNLTSLDFLLYFGEQRLKLPRKIIDNILKKIFSKIKDMQNLIEISFLSENKKKEYELLLKERCSRL